MFVAIEGGDAVGKNTLTTKIFEWVLVQGNRAKRYTCPNYEGPIGRVILDRLLTHRALSEPLELQCMMMADRYATAAKIDRDLLTSAFVVVDRWWQSAYVYGHATGIEKSLLMDMHEHLPQAQINILLDLPWEQATTRRPYKRDSYEKNEELMKKVRQGYLDLWTQNKDRTPDKWVVIDASQSPDEVFAQAIKHIEARKLTLK